MTDKERDEISTRMAKLTVNISHDAKERVLRDHDRIHGLTDLSKEANGEDFDPIISAIAVGLTTDILHMSGLSPKEIGNILTTKDSPFRMEHIEHQIVAYLEIYYDMRKLEK